MKRRSVVLLSILAIGAASAVLFRIVMAEEASEPIETNPLPVVLAEGTARPTFTPIPPPLETKELITRAEAVDKAVALLTPAEASHSIDADSLEVELSTVGETSISLHDESYPIWMVSAVGEFHPLTR